MNLLNSNPIILHTSTHTQRIQHNFDRFYLLYTVITNP